jgi:hypothetical protein
MQYGGKRIASCQGGQELAARKRNAIYLTDTAGEIGYEELQR